MASASPSSSSGDAWLYQWDELYAAGQDHPHATFESWNSFQRNVDQDIDRTSIIKQTYDQIPPPKKRETKDVLQDWETANRALKIEQPGGTGPNLLTNIQEQLNTILTTKPAVQRFFLLGMGSPHDEQCGKEAVMQYLQAKDLITHCVTKRSLGYGESNWDAFIDKCPAEIVCDSSRWHESDLKFVRDEVFGGALEHCTFLHAPLSHMLYVADSPYVFVIMFNPDNPVRQMLADLALHSNSRPRAIVCAHASVDTPSRCEGIFERDESSPRVTEFLDWQYIGMECKGLPDLAPGSGKPWLYVDRSRAGDTPITSVWPSVHSTPSAADKPRPTNTPNDRVASPHAGVIAKSERSEATETSSPHAWMELPVREGEVHLYRG
jgi:hypothetical protein